MNMEKLISCLKISLVAVLAIVTAEFLHLDFAISAGIVAILSVQPTKKETIKTASSRFLAFVVALAISFVCYKVIGFNSYAFFVYVVAFIAVCHVFGWYSAMAMDSVLISHFISLGQFGFTELKNECLLFIIGVGFGIAANLFLKKDSRYIEELKDQTDELIRLSLHRMSQRIVDVNLPNYDGTCFDKMNESISKAKKIAGKNFNNQLTSKDTYDQRYILMRQEQVQILWDMYRCLKDISSVPSTAPVISQFFEKVSEEYHKDNDVKKLCTELDEIILHMKDEPLPKDRQEFEDRASLYVLLHFLKEFLETKKRFMAE